MQRAFVLVAFLTALAPAQDPEPPRAPPAASASDWEPYLGFWRGALVHHGTVQLLEADLRRVGSRITADLSIPEWISWPVDPVTPTLDDGLLILEVAYGVASLTLDPARHELRGYLIAGPSVIQVHLKRALRPPRLRVVEREIHFEGGGVPLVGTLTLPPWGGPHPLMVWIPSRGEYARYSSRARVWALYGVASFDWDKRGCAKSGGDLSRATFSDLVEDTRAALRTAIEQPEVDGKQIVLHASGSGSWVAIRTAANPALPIRGIVTFLGPATSVRAQQDSSIQAWLEEKGFSAEDGAHAREWLRLSFDAQPTPTEWERYQSLSQRAKSRGWDAIFVDAPMNRASFRHNWFRRHDYDPARDLAQVRSSWLAIYGAKDTVVPPEEHRTALTRALEKAGNRDLTTVILPDWEHGQDGWSVERRQATDSPFDSYVVWEKSSAFLWQTQIDWVLGHVQRSPSCPLE